jgi:uncharacterized protein (TIGR00251 family)
MAATLRVRVIPRARKTELAGRRQGALLVRLTAPPVEGAANRLLLRFLAAHLGVRPADVTLLSGETSRDKVVRVEGLTEAEVQERLPGGE